MILVQKYADYQMLCCGIHLCSADFNVSNKTLSRMYGYLEVLLFFQSLLQTERESILIKLSGFPLRESPFLIKKSLFFTENPPKNRFGFQNPRILPSYLQNKFKRWKNSSSCIEYQGCITYRYALQSKTEAICHCVAVSEHNRSLLIMRHRFKRDFFISGRLSHRTAGCKVFGAKTFTGPSA